MTTPVRPLNIAHRGGAGLWPENTLAAFRHAFAMGCDGAELDAQLSADGEVVVFHDFRLKPDICRGAGGAWITAPAPRVKDLTFAELQAYGVGRLKPGSAYAASHPDQQAIDGERIPALRDVIRLAKGFAHRPTLWIEIKTDFANRANAAAPAALADAIIAVLRAEDYLDRAVMVGFDWAGLLRTKALAPTVPCFFTTLPQSWFAEGAPPESHWPPEPQALAVLRHWHATEAPWAAGFDTHRHGSLAKAIKAAGGDGWFPFWPDLTPETAAAARAEGLALAAWTVDDPDGMRRLSGLGVSAICTDRPDRLAALFPR